MACTLEAARVQRGVSKEAIIRETGLTKPTVYKALRGERVSLGSTLLIAAAIGMTASEVSPEAAAVVAALAEVS